jgi:hypothetical protein
LTPAVVAGVAAAAVAVVGVAIVVLRRSLLAVAFGTALTTLGLVVGAGLAGDRAAAGAILAAGVAAVVGLTSAAVAVHRRRGADFIDELRELGGG